MNKLKTAPIPIPVVLKITIISLSGDIHHTQVRAKSNQEAQKLISAELSDLDIAKIEPLRNLGTARSYIMRNEGNGKFTLQGDNPEVLFNVAYLEQLQCVA